MQALDYENKSKFWLNTKDNNQFAGWVSLAPFSPFYKFYGRMTSRISDDQETEIEFQISNPAISEMDGLAGIVLMDGGFVGVHSILLCLILLKCSVVGFVISQAIEKKLKDRRTNINQRI